MKQEQVREIGRSIAGNALSCATSLKALLEQRGNYGDLQISAAAHHVRCAIVALTTASYFLEEPDPLPEGDEEEEDPLP